MTDLFARWQGALMDNYGTPPLALVRGRGCTVWDADGRAYTDLIAGIATCVLGHCHPAVVGAATAQMATLGHVSNLYLTEPAVALAERLLGLLGGRWPADGRVFFANSGAEANEAALKIARKFGGRDRPVVVAMEGSFHGRTLGALSVTGQPAKRAPFEPLMGEVRFVPYGDADALAAAVDRRTAAVFCEPMLGEGGVYEPAPGFLGAARQVTADAGALLVLDEVQTGTGRTGRWFAHQAAGVVPDVVTLAKGLGGGLPVGACLALGDAAGVLARGDHGSTFGGNPVVCAAALAVIETVEAEGLLARATAAGDRLAAGVAALDHPAVAGTRGSGLLRAVALAEPCAASAPVAEAALRDVGFLVNAVQPDSLRVAPPLVVSDAELDGFVAALPAALDRVVGARVGVGAGG